MKQPRAKLYISFFELLKAYFKILFGFGLTKDKKVKEFENLLENYWQRKKCFTLSTCRLALYYVLKSLKLKKGDEIILTPIQIPDFVNAILNLGLRPIFVEVDKKTKCLDLDDLKRKINNKTKVVLATYLTGIVPDISKIQKICEENNIFLIEDISQSYGSSYNLKKAGTFGLAAIGSLSPAKIISSVGGGFILIDDKKTIEEIILNLKNELSLPKKKTLLKICIFQLKVSLLTSTIMFNFFSYYLFYFLSIFFKGKFRELHHPTFKYTHKDKTIYDNPTVQRKLPDELFFQFIDLQAEIAIKTFRKNINHGLKKRQNLAKVLYDNLNDKAKKCIPSVVSNYDQNCFWHFPIILSNENLEKFQSFLMRKGYDVVGYGLKLCNNESAFENYKTNLSSAKLIQENTLFLPIFDNMNNADMEKIAKNVNLFFESH